MYSITERQLGQFQDEIAKRDQKIEKLTIKQRAQKAGNQAKIVGEIVGASLLMGAVRGKFEAADGSFNIPGLNFDAELALGIAVTGAGLVMAQQKGKAARYADDALTVGSALLGGYMRGVARHWGKTGQFKMTAVGADMQALPAGWMGYSESNPSVLDALTHGL